MESILKNTPLRFVKLQNGETIAYRDFKHDSAVLHTIVLVHGNNQDNRAWLPFVVNIALNDHRIIAMDMRGYGESSYVNRVESHDDNADDIYNLIEELKLVKPMLMGWSTGGAAVVACVTKYPGVAKCAFLMSSVPFDGLRMPVVDAKGKLVNPRRWIATWEESLHFGRVTLVAANFQSPDVDLTHRLWSAFAFLPGTAPAQESFEFRELIDSGSKKQRNNDDLRWANITFNVTPMQTPAATPSDRLKRLRCPIAVLHGQNDKVCNFAQMKAIVDLINAERIASDSIRLYVHQGGHMPIYEVRDEFVALYREALQETLQMLAKSRL